MAESVKREVWQRGPVAGIPPLLQPVAHAILQTQEDVHKLMSDFPESLLWEKPAGLASPAFHVKHLAGVLDRLFTYARGEGLSEEQLTSLSYEGGPLVSDHPIQDLLQMLDAQVDRAMAQLRSTDENTLLEPRAVGRAQIPSSVLGILFHAGEHTQRHVGQLLVTVQMLKGLKRLE